MNREKYIQTCCTGCGLCHSTKGTKMVKDDNGYNIPLNIGEGYYESVCPTFKYTKKDTKFSVWGEYENTYSCYSSDDQIRFRASSGGALTSISIYLLEEGIVDGIIHTGVAENDPMGTQTFVSKSKEEVLQHMGSRYSVSAPLMDILSLLKEGEKYAFIGKPCDVSALKRYSNNINDISDRIIITMSFFCAGMPSDKINLELLESMGCSKERLKTFQYRGSGWPGFATAIDLEGNEYRMEYEKAWGKYLGRDVKLICRYCMDGIGESADISCADLWYLNKDNKPDFSENDGRNIVFCRNKPVDKVFNEAVNKGYLNADKFTDEMYHFDDYQPYQFLRRVTMKYRLLVLKIFGRFRPKYSSKLLREASKYATVEMKYSIIKGTIKRVIKGKL